VTTRFVIIGGGPAGNTAATYAARLGAQVTMIERDVVGGAAHLWDCIPSKTMIATGGAMTYVRRSSGMGLEQADAAVDTEALSARIEGIKSHLQHGATQLLESQGVRLVRGSARFTSPHEVEVDTLEGSERIAFDWALVATGSRPRIPDWCAPDGDRILTTRDCYPPKVFPASVTVIGSGVTGVEFVHMFSSFGAEVTLVVSRQQVLPGKDPEVAAVLEDDFLRRGVRLLKGARATAIERDGDGVVVRCDDGRVVRSSHAVLAIGSVPNSAELGLDAAGVETDAGGYVPIDHNCVTNVRHIYAAGDVSGKLPLSSVAAMQGRKVAERLMGLHQRDHRHLDYDKAASAIPRSPTSAWPRRRPSPSAARSASPRCRSRPRPRRSSTTTPAASSRSSPTRRRASCSAARSSVAMRPS
jgi:dihydrolipoamide dehydrogenase